MVERIDEDVSAGIGDELRDFVIAEQVIDRAAKNAPLSAQHDVGRAHYLQLRQAIFAVDCPPVQFVQVMCGHNRRPFH